MEKIYLLTDYRGRFGSKHDDTPYRSGMDHMLLEASLKEKGFVSEFVPLSDVRPGDCTWSGKLVMYTSSEDYGLAYKQYIEDIVFALELAGARVIPAGKFLRAHNNKVFMELLRDLLPEELRGGLVSSHYGTAEELEERIDEISFPVIVKGHSGAMGRNVFLAHTAEELMKTVRRRIAVKASLRFRIKEYLRQYKHPGYRRESFYRSRFIVQKFIPGLENDWKVYFFGERAFVFRRPVIRKREFRASGGGYDNYSYGRDAGAPDGLLDFGWSIFRALGVPFVSMDLAWDGRKFFMLEFQCVYFGTAGILKRYSEEYFLRENEGWRVVANDGQVEKTFAGGVSWFVNQAR
jgi:glutathione synthase/RimK-type ligase-like ATP-grasp enzyme